MPSSVNSRIEAAKTTVDETTGIRRVIFTCAGVPEWPTALKSGADILGDITKVFRNGAASVNLPMEYSRDSRGPELFVCTTMLAADGSALGNEDKKLLASYKKIIDFPVPGFIDIFLDTGPTETPPTQRQLVADVSVYLLTEDGAADSNTVKPPYHIKRWVKYGSNYIPSETGIAASEGGGARGYLAGQAWSGAYTTYKGMDVDGLSSWLSSEPTYAQFLSDMAQGQIVSRDVAPAFCSADGTRYFLMTETFVQAQL